MVGLPLPNFLLRMPGCKAHKVGVCNLQSRHFRPQLGLPNLINHLGFQNPPSVLESFPEQIPLSAASSDVCIGQRSSADHFLPGPCLQHRAGHRIRTQNLAQSQIPGAPSPPLLSRVRAEAPSYHLLICTVGISTRLRTFL